jgi:hypothetical protein
MSRGRVRKTILGCALAALVVGSPPRAQQQAAAPTGGLIRPGEAPQLELIFTGDVIGYIDPCG